MGRMHMGYEIQTEKIFMSQVGGLTMLLLSARASVLEILL